MSMFCTLKLLCQMNGKITLKCLLYNQNFISEVQQSQAFLTFFSRVQVRIFEYCLIYPSSIKQDLHCISKDENIHLGERISDFFPRVC